MNIHTCYSYGITLYGAMNKITIKISLNVKLTSNNVKKKCRTTAVLRILLVDKDFAQIHRVPNRNRSTVNLYRILTLQNWFLASKNFPSSRWSRTRSVRQSVKIPEPWNVKNLETSFPRFYGDGQPPDSRPRRGTERWKA